MRSIDVERCYIEEEEEGNKSASRAARVWHWRVGGTNRLLSLRERVQLLRHPPDKVPMHRLELFRLFTDRMRASSDGLTSVSDEGQVGAFDFGFAFCRDERQG